MADERSVDRMNGIAYPFGMEPSTVSSPRSTPPSSLAARLRGRVNAAAGGLPRTFWVLCAGTFVNRSGAFVMPFLSVYLTEARGYPMATAGLVVTLYGAGALTAGVVGGACADHFGRRATMVAALGLGGLGMIGLGFAHDLRVIAPAAFIVALLGEAYRPAISAAVSDLVAPVDRVRAFGIVYWVVNLGFSVGALLGGALASASFLLLFVGDGLTSLVFAALIWRSVPETRPAPAPRPHGPRRGIVREFLAPFHDAPFAVFTLLCAIVFLIFLQHMTAFPIDMAARGVSRAWLGAVLAINGIVIVLLQPVLAPALQRRDHGRVVAVGASLVGAGFGLNALAHGPGMFALGVLVWTIGEIFVIPTASAVVADVAPPDMRGRYQGAYGMSFGVARFAGPILGTAVMQRWGSSALWAGCTAAGIVAAAGMLLVAPSLAQLRRERAASHAL
jgi:MFS family permease